MTVVLSELINEIHDDLNDANRQINDPDIIATKTNAEIDHYQGQIDALTNLLPHLRGITEL
jgi:peptidoglycan hydrolase CwlO-like protein